MKKNALPFLEGFLFLVILLHSCSADVSSKNPVEVSDNTGDLQVVVNNSRLRESPSPQGKILGQPGKGEILVDLGGVSDRTTQIRFGAETFDEPWLQVSTRDGHTGWIYARDVAPVDDQIPLSSFRRRKQLQSIFGKESMVKLADYQNQWLAAKTEEEVAEIYHRGLILRDTLLPFLEKRSYQYNGEELPDLFWIGDYIPGYVPQLVAEGTVYYLFNDYQKWLEKAQGSQGRQDDRFFGLLIECYPQDSIEYFYPAWEVQSWDYGTYNLLGRGLAFRIMASVNRTFRQSPLFFHDLQSIKDQLLKDITRPNIHFWEPDSLVIHELDSIIQANWSIFTPTDRIALDTRRMQLDSATLNGIRFDARAGEN